MMNETDVIHSAQPSASTGGFVPTIDQVTYRFRQPIDLLGMPIQCGSGFSFCQKKMKLWFMVKGLWSVVRYNPPVINQCKVETVIVYTICNEKDGVPRAVILAVLTNTLFNVYSSDAYNTKLLKENFDQTYNADSQGLEKYFCLNSLTSSQWT